MQKVNRDLDELLNTFIRIYLILKFSDLSPHTREGIKKTVFQPPKQTTRRVPQETIVKTQNQIPWVTLSPSNLSPDNVYKII